MPGMDGAKLLARAAYVWMFGPGDLELLLLLSKLILRDTLGDIDDLSREPDRALASLSATWR